MRTMRIRLLAGAVLALTAAMAAAIPAQAQRNSNLPVQEMNFDLWCQEQAGLPPDRCDKRTPQDDAAFEAYRSKVEAYEIPYLQQKASAARLDTDLLRNDPVDRAATSQPSVARPDLDSPSTTTPPR